MPNLTSEPTSMLSMHIFCKGISKFLRVNHFCGAQTFVSIFLCPSAWVCIHYKEFECLSVWEKNLVQKICESLECCLIECFKEDTHRCSVGGKGNINLLECCKEKTILDLLLVHPTPPFFPPYVRRKPLWLARWFKRPPSSWVLARIKPLWVYCLARKKPQSFLMFEMMKPLWFWCYFKSHLHFLKCMYKSV